jgi:hypothetical protein
MLTHPLVSTFVAPFLDMKTRTRSRNTVSKEWADMWIDYDVQYDHALQMQRYTLCIQPCESCHNWRKYYRCRFSECSVCFDDLCTACAAYSYTYGMCERSHA